MCNFFIVKNARIIVSFSFNALIQFTTNRKTYGGLTLKFKYDKFLLKANHYNISLLKFQLLLYMRRIIHFSN